jgi:DNA-binding NtrC family response regulator
MEKQNCYQNLTALIVDDDEALCNNVINILTARDLKARALSGSNITAGNILANHFDIYIIDVFCGDLCGIELLLDIKKRHSDSIIIIMTAYADGTFARKALQFGAFDFI